MNTIAILTLQWVGWTVVAAQILLVLLTLARADLIPLALLPAVIGGSAGVVGMVSLNVYTGMHPPLALLAVLLATTPVLAITLRRIQAQLDRWHQQPARLRASGLLAMLGALTGLGVLACLPHESRRVAGTVGLLGASLGLCLTLWVLPGLLHRLCLNTDHRTRAQMDGLKGSSPFDARLRTTCALYALHGPAVEQFIQWKLRLDPVFRVLLEHVPAGGVVLDLGCGYGLATHWLTLGNPTRSGIGLDLDAAKIGVARSTTRLNPAARFENADLATAAYPDCDHVLLLDVLHYLPHNLKQTVLQRAFTAMRPGGILVVRDAQATSSTGHRIVTLLEALAVRTGWHRTAHRLQYATLEEHRTWLTDAGFINLTVHSGTGHGSNLLLTAMRPGCRQPGAPHS